MTETEFISTTTQSIEQNRKGNFKLTVQNYLGKPITNAKVTVNQTKHEFLFGANLGGMGNGIVETIIGELFNFGTLGIFWALMETSPGVYDVWYPQAVADWCLQRGIVLKGHPLLWGLSISIPKWITVPTLEQQQAHVNKMVGEFKNKIDIWDVVNEPIHQNLFDFKPAYSWMRSLQPTDKLCINEYDVLSGKFPQFLQFLKDNASVPYDIIGLQCHIYDNEYVSMQTINEQINTFKDLGKKIHITEISVTSNGAPIFGSSEFTVADEATQAKQLERIYRTCFANPNVSAITSWGIMDGDPWRPNIGIVRNDGSKKPAYYTLQNLIKKEWWTNTSVTTDSKGIINFRGFYGNYNVIVNGKTFTINLRDGNKTIKV